MVNDPTELRHSSEHRYFLDVTARLPLSHGFTLLDRNRGELRDLDGLFSRRYRNRLQLERAFSARERRIPPYIAGERFYEDRYHH